MGKKEKKENGNLGCRPFIIVEKLSFLTFTWTAESWHYIFCLVNSLAAEAGGPGRFSRMPAKCPVTKRLGPGRFSRMSANPGVCSKKPTVPGMHSRVSAHPPLPLRTCP
eukprot:516805-Pelagomonas_calceolata.AAC.2